jgi:hypothetical protein
MGAHSESGKALPRNLGFYNPDFGVKERSGLRMVTGWITPVTGFSHKGIRNVEDGFICCQT